MFCLKSENNHFPSLTSWEKEKEGIERQRKDKRKEKSYTETDKYAQRLVNQQKPLVLSQEPRLEMPQPEGGKLDGGANAKAVRGPERRWPALN